MIILPNKGLAFISITKCASTTIESAFKRYKGIFIGGTPGLKHTKYRQIEQFILPFLEAKKVQRPHFFAVTREPADRLMSWYKFRQRDDLANARSSHRFKKNFVENMSFEEFAEGALARKEHPFKVETQHSFVVNSQNKVMVDTLVRIEYLDAFLPDFLRGFKIKPPQKMARRNISPTNKDKGMSDALRAEINQSALFREDYELYLSSLSAPEPEQLQAEAYKET
ncbi:MAG: sulfotransferase family 2 domain-containing protein [Leisingera sp.]